ncbi:hypothetical protein [Pseudalkalibacillus caeni]|uniref:Uncharacterized protein n=1 Tax=Exobacillus caeni TaxID=2574798 RepID=A0A5R9FAP4_9BACL|nr:hypothetical protein [Pseudalkalibacillus caeni]TLS37943.1 hypothetical protein FCL54_09000 [Pseudalkalibacillus caeni]
MKEFAWLWGRAFLVILIALNTGGCVTSKEAAKKFYTIEYTVTKVDKSNVHVQTNGDNTTNKIPKKYVHETVSKGDQLIANYDVVFSELVSVKKKTVK